MATCCPQVKVLLKNISSYCCQHSCFPPWPHSSILRFLDILSILRACIFTVLNINSIQSSLLCPEKHTCN